MKRHKKVSILLIIIVLVIAVIVFKKTTPSQNPERISHTYTISADKILVVDNWDCGATCPSHTSVYIKELNKDSKKTTIFSCDYLADIEFTNIGTNSATISKMLTTKETNNSECAYKEGDIVSF